MESESIKIMKAVNNNTFLCPNRIIDQGECVLNPLTAKSFNLNFHPLQVSENYSDLTKWRSTVFKYC